jgi:hypothetical protein
MKTLKIGAAALLMVGTTLALGACADGYRDHGYSSVSVGVSSSGGYGDRHHHRGAFGDRDHDGTPNAFDDHPRNPYRD